jgi:hypothetical protein
MVVGSDYFFTFDGRSYNLSGSCVYLLAGDLVDGNFTVSIQYKMMSDGRAGHQILVAAGHNTLIVDFEANVREVTNFFFAELRSNFECRLT